MKFSVVLSFFLLYTGIVHSQSSVYIEQIGDQNTTSLIQQGDSQTMSVVMSLSTANNITATQIGPAANLLNISGTGLNDNITVFQSGNSGANKTFQLNLVNAVNAEVSIVQTNPNIPNTGSMTITCLVACAAGTHSYVRR